MGKDQFPSLGDGPAAEDGWPVVTLPAGVDGAGIIDVVEVQGASDPLHSRLVHLLERDDICIPERTISKHLDGRPDPIGQLDIEADHLKSAGVGLGLPSPGVGVPTLEPG
jgi:hypothetical protein